MTAFVTGSLAWYILALPEDCLRMHSRMHDPLTTGWPFPKKLNFIHIGHHDPGVPYTSAFAIEDAGGDDHDSQDF